ncbi:MAG: hypothetical protein AB2731_10250 [Candidatus Thiodiazotropha sp.]|nr:hypothetical protein [Candidatus Thiodiazotropha sp. (ex Codakia orbicularis)]
MYANGSNVVNQQTWSGAAGDDSMDYAESQPYFNDQLMVDVPCGISGFSTCREKGEDAHEDRTLVGVIHLEDELVPTLEIDTYQEWLQVHYGLDIQFSEADPSRINQP